MLTNAYPTRCAKCRGDVRAGDGLFAGRDRRGKASYHHRGEFDGRRCAKAARVGRPTKVS